MPSASTQEAGVRQIAEFEDSLIYRVSSMIPKAAQRILFPKS